MTQSTRSAQDSGAASGLTATVVRSSAVCQEKRASVSDKGVDWPCFYFARRFQLRSVMPERRRTGHLIVDVRHRRSAGVALSFTQWLGRQLAISSSIGAGASTVTSGPLYCLQRHTTYPGRQLVLADPHETESR